MILNSTQSRFSGFAFIFFLILIGTGCGQQSDTSMTASSETEYNRAGDVLRYDGEEHIRNIKQLTFGGNNAEAYWSSNDEALVFQSDWDRINDQGCDQIFVMNPSAGTITGQGDDYTLISTGMGRTTCSFFMPGDQEIVFASTHEAATE